jgi:hypothetical protein
MAVEVLTNCGAYLGASRIADKTNSAVVRHEAAMLTSDTFGFATARKAPGLLSGGINLKGYCDPSTYDIETTVFNAAPYMGPNALSIPLTVLQKDEDFGVGYAINAKLSQFETLGAQGQLIPYTLNSEIGAGAASQKNTLIRGNNLVYGSKTVTGSGTARQLGAVLSTQRLYAALHVYSFVGTSLTMRLQSDNGVGMGTPVAQITFGALAAAGSEWAEVAGPITDDWWRADWTFSGTSFAAILLVGIR